MSGGWKALWERAAHAEAAAARAVRQAVEVRAAGGGHAGAAVHLQLRPLRRLHRVRPRIPEHRLEGAGRALGAVQLPLPLAQPGLRAGAAAQASDRAIPSSSTAATACRCSSPRPTWPGCWARASAARWRPALWITILAAALPSLLYQNSGYQQFGYRFSNDYIVYLIVLLAVGGQRFGWLFKTLLVLAAAINLSAPSPSTATPSSATRTTASSPTAATEPWGRAPRLSAARRGRRRRWEPTQPRAEAAGAGGGGGGAAEATVPTARARPGSRPTSRGRRPAAEVGRDCMRRPGAALDTTPPLPAPAPAAGVGRRRGGVAGTRPVHRGDVTAGAELTVGRRRPAGRHRGRLRR